jgi:glucan biosynthesis protein
VTYTIDFADAHAGQRDGGRLEVDATATDGAKILSRRVQPISHEGWRVTLEAESPSAGKPIQLDCRLHDRRQVISEIWRYRFED